MHGRNSRKVQADNQFLLTHSLIVSPGRVDQGQIFSNPGNSKHRPFNNIYSGVPIEFMETPLIDLLKQVEAGKLPLQVGKVFHIDDIVQAHDTMEKNLARGKIVVLTE